MGSMEWFKEVEPLLKKTGETPPMECMQVSVQLEVFKYQHLQVEGLKTPPMGCMQVRGVV